MEIYIQSRGYSQDDDYCWRPEAPGIIRTNRVNDLIQSESPSVVLTRYNGKLLLLVTGLEASERTDFHGRKIRNSVAWVDKDCKKNEEKFRGIAVYALRGLLEDDIDKAVKFGGEDGFEVSFDTIDTITKLNIKEVGNLDAECERKIGKNFKDFRDALVGELQEHHLPRGNDFSKSPLVVVTGIKSEVALKQAGVWRGLSNLVQGEEWKDYKYCPSEQAEAGSTLIFPFLFIFLMPTISIIFFFNLYLLLSQPQPKPNQETQLLPQPVSPSTQPVQSSSPQSQVLENKLNAAPEISETQTPSIGLVKQTKTPTSLDLGTVNTDNSASQPEATKESTSTVNAESSSLTETAASETVKQQITTDTLKLDSQPLQQPTDKTLPSKLVEPPKNPLNSSGEIVKPDV